ncbi:MAG: prolyl oligopeptidase family serine peptidase [Cyanobacteriota bacterium]|nr:prolyl oligopeptidase family serine peptidase [Cyanobacteriota bacterium]
MQAPAGSAPLSAAAVVGSTPVIKEPRLCGGQLYWLEQRPQESGRTTLLRRAADDAEAQAVELTPAPWNLRSRIHEYGGGAVSIGADQIVFVHDGDRCLWHLDLQHWLDTSSPPPPQSFRRLTSPADPQRPRAFADGLIDAARQRWLGVMEAGGCDQLVAVPLAGGEPELLRQADFCGYAALSPSGTQLAWLEWQQPAMPWQSTSLWLADLDAAGNLQSVRALAGAAAGQVSESLFQPLWITGSDGDETLVVASDRSGFWNLQRYDGTRNGWIPLLPLPAEFAMPQWVYGMRTSAWSGERLLALCCREGAWELGEVPLGSTQDASNAKAEVRWQPRELPFNDLAWLDADANRVVAVASSPRCGPGLLNLELTSGRWQHTPASPEPCPLHAAQISLPEPLWFAGYGGARTHAWYYPPQGGDNPEAPLLVKSHSGPTSMARTGLSLGIQFWTSRGWGVVDVNYGGSTGFGRAFRERLDGQWGVVDVGDCAAAARALIAAGKAHPGRIAIEGGSAGGFTTLAALCFSDVFSAGASRYGVADLTALAADTHRFEAGYLESLVGPWPAARDTYAARSPLQHADRMHCPVIFFQGLQDKVVPPAQTERMASALRDKGIAVEVHTFTDEGHGFRSSSVQIEVLEATEAFFRRHLQLP